MKLTHVLSLVSVIAVTGCSTGARPGNYECELHDTVSSSCASVSQAYQAANAPGRTHSSDAQSVFEARTAPAPATALAPVVGQASGYPDVGEAGMPVFAQPKVMRVWVAPYVDASGNLRSGEYTYFSTPGAWNYGSLKKPGAVAKGMFGPAREGNLGFVPVDSAAKPAPPAPAESRPAAGPATTAAAAGSTPSITQPYQRLTTN